MISHQMICDCEGLEQEVQFERYKHTFGLWVICEVFNIIMPSLKAADGHTFRFFVHFSVCLLSYIY